MQYEMRVHFGQGLEALLERSVPRCRIFVVCRLATEEESEGAAADQELDRVGDGEGAGGMAKEGAERQEEEGCQDDGFRAHHILPYNCINLV